MQLNFSDLYGDTLRYSSVLITMGNYSLFNNIAADIVRERAFQECRIDYARFMGVPDGADEISLKELGNIVDFDKFMDYSKSPAFLGKWFCSVDYKMLNNKQKELLETYIKYPNKYGRLVVELNDFKDYKKFNRNMVFKRSEQVNLIKLSFPNKTVLKDIITSKCSGITIHPKALDLFIMRMSDNYDEYGFMIGLLEDSGYTEISYDSMKDLLSGVENYALEDFIGIILKPPANPRASKRKAYGMMRIMIDDMGGVKLINSIKRTIEKLIEIRTYINQGLIPGRIKYSMKEFKDKLPEESLLKNTSDFIIRKNIDTALDCSLRDLMFIKLILQNNSGFSDEACELTLIKVINRALVSSDRLLSDIGLQDDMDRILYKLNRVLLDAPRLENKIARRQQDNIIEEVKNTEDDIKVTKCKDVEKVDDSISELSSLFSDKVVDCNSNEGLAMTGSINPNDLFNRKYTLDEDMLALLDS